MSHRPRALSASTRDQDARPRGRRGASEQRWGFRAHCAWARSRVAESDPLLHAAGTPSPKTPPWPPNARPPHAAHGGSRPWLRGAVSDHVRFVPAGGASHLRLRRRTRRRTERPRAPRALRAQQQLRKGAFGGQTQSVAAGKGQPRAHGLRWGGVDAEAAGGARRQRRAGAGLSGNLDARHAGSQF